MIPAFGMVIYPRILVLAKGRFQAGVQGILSVATTDDGRAADLATPTPAAAATLTVTIKHWIIRTLCT